jgi:hypothetical protein
MRQRLVTPNLHGSCAHLVVREDQIFATTLQIER